MTPEQENELENQLALQEKISEWERVMREKDGDEKYIEAQFSLGTFYAMSGEYDKFQSCFERIYNIDNSFTYYVFCKISKTLKKENIHFFPLISAIFFAQRFINDVLYIEFGGQYERKLAHYTSLKVVNNLLSEESKFRLNNIYNMNDPTEGEVLLQYINNKLCLNNEYKDIEFTPFVACFTLNHDNLNQFRLYGKSNDKEATGVSLVFGEGFFGKKSKGDLIFVQVPKAEQLSLVRIASSPPQNKSFNTLDWLPNNNHISDLLENLKILDGQKDEWRIESQAIYRCIYIDPETGYIRLAQRDKMTFYREFYQEKTLDEIEGLWNEYSKYIQEKEKNIKEILEAMKEVVGNIVDDLGGEDQKEILKLVGLILLPLQYLVKHSAFQEEQECRMCYITSLNDPCITMDFDKKWLYIDYPEPVKPHIKNVYIATGAKEYYPFIVRLLGENSASKVQLSKNPFRT